LGNGVAISLVDRVYILEGIITAEGAQAGSYMNASSCVIQGPVNAQEVIAVLQASQTIGLCDQLTLNGGQSIGNAGRALTYLWELPEEHNPGLVLSEAMAIREFLSEKSGSTVDIPYDMLDGSEYTLTLRVTNWLGSQSDYVNITVFRLPVPLPSIFLSSTTVVMSAASELSISASSSAPDTSCADPDANNTFEVAYSWELLSGPNHLDFTAPLSTQAYLSMAAHSFEPGATYQLQVRVDYIDPQTNNIFSSNNETCAITISRATPVAILTPGTGLDNIYTCISYYKYIYFAC